MVTFNHGKHLWESQKKSNKTIKGEKAVVQ